MDLFTIQRSLVRFRTRRDVIVGAGFLITDRHILTCAHVVNSALGQPRDNHDCPVDPVALDFPFTAAAQAKAQVVQWFLNPSDPTTNIAVLELIKPRPQDTCILTLERDDGDRWGQEAHALGFPDDYREGVGIEGEFLTVQASGLLQVDASPKTQFFVEEGFSGAPIWDAQYRCAGMIVGVANGRTAFLIPAQFLAQLLAPHISLPELEVAPFIWQSGATFDKYGLRELLGTGGNGQVWLADEYLPDGTARQVAIKVLRGSVSQNPLRAARFRREIGTMARIDYPSVVRVYTYGECGGQLYAVMPYLKGGTLRARLVGQPLPEADALRLLEQVGAALDYVHDRHSGLIHRDVKPENMLFSEDGETLYLSDFGLVFSIDGDERLTEDGKPIGTGRYMAPEQWRSQPLSRQTDLYALGILAYELLTGHLPFQEKNDLDLGRAHCECELPSDPNLSDEVLRILCKAAAKAPGERYPTARAFLTDLRNWRVDPANLEPRIRDYLQWVTDELYEGVRAQFVELAGEETAQHMLPARPKGPTWDDADDLFARASATIHADHVAPEDETRKTFAENVRERLLALDRAVLVGEPGSGKTWMLRRLQADYARAWLKQTGEGRGLIPVLVRLNDYSGGTFADFVKRALDMLAPYHDQLRREGQLVLLCDALNEMPRGAGQMVQLAAYLKNTLYFVVSCRVRDYRDDLNDLKPLEQVLLRDLELDAIRDLVHKRLPGDLGAALWQQMGGTDALFDFWLNVRDKGEVERFWDAKTKWWRLGGNIYPPRDWYAIFRQGARLIPLARSPYMGDLLCRTYQESGSLPDSRAALFKQFVGQMLARERTTAARRGEIFPEVKDIEAALVALTRALQDAKGTVIAQMDAPKAVGRVDAEALLKAAIDANILGVEGENLKFTHQLLQEYFAVQILLQAIEAGRSPAEVFRQEWWDAGVWRETTVILGELLGERAQGANAAARWIAPVSPEVALQVITRNDAGLTLMDVEEATRDLLVKSAHEKTDEPNPIGRAAAYRVLDLFNADKRHGIGLRADGFPDIDWVEIPAGEFIYQRGQRLTLPTFYIARYPVTYCQFQTFLDAPDGFERDEWWAELTPEYRKQPMDGQRLKYANHPRDSVSWYQAVAFCRWLSAKLPEDGWPVVPGPGSELKGLVERLRGKKGQADWVIRLPTEQEFEKVARGTDGREYPYKGSFDASKGNTRETGIGQAGAAGIFPSGASPYDVLDMSGNVYTWCLNEYGSPKNTALAGDATRVLRGGSWNLNYHFARCAYRGGSAPDLRDVDLGFRTVCAVPMP